MTVCVCCAQVVSACDRMVSSGIGYTDASRAFSVSVKDLASHFQENEVIAVSMSGHVCVCVCVCAFTTYSVFIVKYICEF